MPWTPLHAVLGEPSPKLSFDLIERVCAVGVSERSDLDWKSSLPLTATDEDGKRAQQSELAKDIAAMANSGGGMIVYGVDERRRADTSAAGQIQPVGPITESTLQTISQIAGNLIYPPVMSLHLVPLAGQDADVGVLVMLVPDSPDAPHLVHPRGNVRDWFAVPWRDGPHTAWMVERQIAAAYQRREVARRRSATDLDELYGSFARACVTGDSTWVLGVAQPDVPAGNDRRLTLQRADTILRSPQSVRLPAAVSALDLTQGAMTRRGLRLFHRTRSDSSVSVSGRMGGRVQLHGSGAVAVGTTRGRSYVGGNGGPHEVSVLDIEQVGLDLMGTLLTTTRAMGMASDYTVRIGVYPVTQVFRKPDPVLQGHYQPFDEQDRVYDYRTVDGPVLMSGGLEAPLGSTIEWVRLS